MPGDALNNRRMITEALLTSPKGTPESSAPDFCGLKAKASGFQHPRLTIDTSLKHLAHTWTVQTVHITLTVLGPRGTRHWCACFCLMRAAAPASSSACVQRTWLSSRRNGGEAQGYPSILLSSKKVACTPPPSPCEPTDLQVVHQLDSLNARQKTFRPTSGTVGAASQPPLSVHLGEVYDHRA